MRRYEALEHAPLCCSGHCWPGRPGGKENIDNTTFFIVLDYVCVMRLSTESGKI